MIKPKRTRKTDLVQAIAEFQLVVRRYARADEPDIELPTRWLVQIAEALDYVRLPGRPPKDRAEILGESLSILKARLRIDELKEQGQNPVEALERVARGLKRTDEMFKKLSLSTIKDRLQRRKGKRRRSGK